MAKSSKLKAVPKENPVFDPKEAYQWQAEDVFPITGKQLHLLNQMAQLHVQSPEIQKALYIVECSKELQAIIKEGVEEGIIKAAPKTQDTPVKTN